MALAAWVFSGARQQPSPEELSSAWVVKAQPTPKEQVSTERGPSPSLPLPEPHSPPQTAASAPATVIAVRPPYDALDVRTIRAGGRMITLAGIEGFDQNAPCRARDGTRWSCAKLARDAVRSRVGSQSLNCIAETEASATLPAATCMTNAGYDVACVLGRGWLGAGHG